MPPEGYDYKLTILGEPSAQQRHRSTLRLRADVGVQVKTQRGIETLYRKEDFWIMNYDPSAKTKADILLLTKVMAPPQPLEGPIRVDVHLWYSFRKGDYGTGRNKGKLKPSAPIWKISAPDRDNADKILLDALQGTFWRNDSIVCAGEILQKYSEKPRTEIYITQLTATVAEVKQENLFERSNQDGN